MDKKRIIITLLFIIGFSIPLLAQKNQMGYTVSYLISEENGISGRIKYSYFLSTQFFTRFDFTFGRISNKYTYWFTDAEIDFGYNRRFTEKAEFYLSTGLGYYIYLHQDVNGNTPYYYTPEEGLVFYGVEKQNSLGLNFKIGINFLINKSVGICPEIVLETIFTRLKKTYQSNRVIITKKGLDNVGQISLGLGISFDI